MASTRKLYMVFTLETGKHMSLCVDQPKADLDRENVEPLMEMIVQKQAFVVGTANLVGIADAYIREVDTEKLI